MTSDQLSVWVGAIRAHEKHAPICHTTWEGSGGVLGETYDNDIGHVKMACTCDQSQRADARLARVLRDAIAACGAECSDRGYDDKFPDGENAALAVVERAAQEGET